MAFHLEKSGGKKWEDTIEKWITVVRRGKNNKGGVNEDNIQRIRTDKNT